MNYTNYKAEDFLTEESFLAWHYRTDTAAVRFWDEWQAQHPEKQADVQEAVRLLELLAGDQAAQVADPQKEAARQRLLANVQAWEEDRTPVIPLQRRRSFWRIGAAASVLLVLAFGWYWFSNRTMTYQTAFGQTQRITLPDGSQVSLNANSKLRLAADWGSAAAREIWLEGEAYFSVKHTKQHSKFIVHAGDVNVEVLGTQFNVWQRQNKTRVVLDEGKVKLSRTQTNQSVIMRPGELVETSESQPALVQKTVRTPVYTAWKENRLVFEDATLDKIARMIEDNYGYRVEMADPQLGNRKFSYTLYGNDLDLLLNTLAESLELSVRRQENSILIESRTSTTN